MTRRKFIPKLSKSRFMAGLQCHKRLWLQLFAPEEAAEVDAVTQAIFDQGTATGELAREYVPGGVLVDEAHTEHKAAVQRTRALLDDPTVPAIYEAAFLHDDVRVRADILARNADGSFDMLEVKSTKQAKPEHVWDVAVQAWVLRGAGVNLRRCGVLHLNGDYVYPGGAHDPQALFTFSEFTAEAAELAAEIPGLLAAMRAPLWSPDEPAVEPGEQCRDPYDCPFMEHCIEPAPKGSIAELYRAGAPLRERLAADGITMLHEIPDGYGLSAVNERIREAVRTGRPYWDAAVAGSLQALPRPVYFIDFETFMPAVPLYVGTSPYQVVPFQWSAHRLDADGTLVHAEFLHDDPDDPREPFLSSLLAFLGDSGPVLVYSSYEATQLRALQAALPALAPAVDDLLSRLVDLLPLVRQNVYHPDFGGSFSIKSVLPALVPDSGYEDLAIADGSSASAAYFGFATGQLASVDWRKVRSDLLAYCKRDTEAMVWLYERMAAHPG